MNFEFHYRSARARKTRIYLRFSRNIRFFTGVFVALLGLVGVGLWITESSVLGSGAVAVAIIISLPLIWYTLDIKKLRPELPSSPTGVVKLENAMAPEVIGKLKDIDSPYSLWLALKDTWWQRIFCLRYSISPENFEQLSRETVQVDVLLQTALTMSQQKKMNQISPVAVLISLIGTLPQADTILANSKLDIEEVQGAIDWIHHDKKVIDTLGQRKRSGGLARDWTSGFTPTLNRMAQNMTQFIEQGGLVSRDARLHDSTINEMIKFLNSARSNVMLVGDVGVGKSMTVYGFAQRIMSDAHLEGKLHYDQVFLLNASTITSATDDPAKAESVLYSIVNEAAKAKNATLFLDDAAGFFGVGSGAVNMGRALMQVVQSGAVPIIFAMTPTEWQTVSAANAELASMLNYLAVPEADQQGTLRVLEDRCIGLEGKHKLIVTYQAVKEAVSLSDRYAQGIAFPGKAVKLLENSINHAEGNFITAASVQQSIEAIYGVKVQVANAVEGQQLLNLEDEIHKRMVNQFRAVKVVSDALRRSRSGVSNRNRPIGTFMFLGPTGVGKTELSKALAAVYFGDASKIIRVDMNEFTQSDDIERLVETTSPTSLLSTVGRNRFSVVLFDEIEKAHPEVVNAFLQLLDEGIMRDASNKEVSFRDTIVIATSNAGAEQIRGYIDAGYEVEQFEKQFINGLIDSHIFKPEFINRFDETVVFRPLKPEELMQIVDLLMAGVNANLARQKVVVVLTEPAKQWLVQQGYDPRLGARPLRRMIQRTVENVVAKKILQSNIAPGSTLQLDVADLQAEAN